jgi:hypothetical protein
MVCHARDSPFDRSVLTARDDRSARLGASSTAGCARRARFEGATATHREYAAVPSTFQIREMCHLARHPVDGRRAIR